MHATPMLDYFSYIDKSVHGEVMLGDNTSLDIKEVGTVNLTKHDGGTITLEEVKWVPKLRRSLMFESIFDDQGCDINTKRGLKIITKNGKELVKANKKNGLNYVLSDADCNVIDKSDSMTTKLTKTLGMIDLATLVIKAYSTCLRMLIEF